MKSGVGIMVHTKAWPLNTALYVKDFCGNSAFLVYYTMKNMGLEKFNAGAGVPSLNRNHLTGIKMNVPDAPLQKHFDELVGPIHEQKEQLVKMNEALRQTRDLLLPRLISGKLSVEGLNIQLPPGMAHFGPDFGEPLFVWWMKALARWYGPRSSCLCRSQPSGSITS
jgi:type I restriction enzyme S subunit